MPAEFSLASPALDQSGTNGNKPVTPSFKIAVSATGQAIRPATAGWIQSLQLNVHPGFFCFM